MGIVTKMKQDELDRVFVAMMMKMKLIEHDRNVLRMFVDEIGKQVNAGNVILTTKQRRLLKKALKLL